MKTIIGIIGPGTSASDSNRHNAFELGCQIAKKGWIIVTGGRNMGVMDAASQGASENNGLTIGILPGSNTNDMSKHIDISIITDMGNARNNIIVLSSHVIVACGLGPGTLSEISLAIKTNKPVVLLKYKKESIAFIKNIGNQIYTANSVDQCIQIISSIL